MESTTTDLVEFVRGIWADVDRRDWEAVLSVFATDAELVRGLVTFEGQDALRGVLEDTIGSYDDLESEVVQVRDLGFGVVFAVVDQRGRLIGSTASVKGRFAWVYQWADGLVARVTVYLDIDEGRADAERLADERRQAMPPENVEELIRWGYEWFNREKEPPPTWLRDGEFVNAREDPDHATYRGIDAIRAQHQGWFDSYPDLHVEPLEIRANGDRVFVWTRFTGHGADSGAAMEMELAHVFTIEDGRTRRLEEYFDRAEALAAVGLTE